MKIPITKLSLDKEEAQAAYDTVLSGWVTQGPAVKKFEETFAEYTGAGYAVAVSSCTAALHLAMLAAGVGEGDEVICPSMSFIATANSITYSGGVPVFAEVDPSTWNLDPEDVIRKITPSTKAVLLVHQMGFPADIDRFREICDEHGLILIEDAACAIGSEYKGRKIGAHSDLVCFSFHPRKVITTGDGGMVTASSGEMYERLKLLRQHGMSVNDLDRHKSGKMIIEEYLEIGYNYRMTDIQASIGLVQLSKLDGLLKTRREAAERYNQAFSSSEYIRTTEVVSGGVPNYQSYPVYLTDKVETDRNELMQKMLDRGIATRRGIMTAHTQKAYEGKYVSGDLSRTVDAEVNSILLPLYSDMEPGIQDYVIKNLKELIGA